VRTQVDDQVGHVVAGVPVAAVENKCCGIQNAYIAIA
jgi:hypothetical protein